MRTAMLVTLLVLAATALAPADAGARAAKIAAKPSLAPQALNLGKIHRLRPSIRSDGSFIQIPKPPNPPLVDFFDTPLPEAPYINRFFDLGITSGAGSRPSDDLRKREKMGEFTIRPIEILPP